MREAKSFFFAISSLLHFQVGSYIFLLGFQRTFRKSLRRFDPSKNLWDDLSKVWRNRFQNTGLIMIWDVCFWVLNINKLQLIFSGNPTTYLRFLITTYLNYLHWNGEYRLRRRSNTGVSNSEKQWQNSVN